MLVIICAKDHTYVCAYTDREADRKDTQGAGNTSLLCREVAPGDKTDRLSILSPLVPFDFKPRDHIIYSKNVYPCSSKSN